MRRAADSKPNLMTWHPTSGSLTSGSRTAGAGPTLPFSFFLSPHLVWEVPVCRQAHGQHEKRASDSSESRCQCAGQQHYKVALSDENGRQCTA